MSKIRRRIGGSTFSPHPRANANANATATAPAQSESSWNSNRRFESRICRYFPHDHATGPECVGHFSLLSVPTYCPIFWIAPVAISERRKEKGLVFIPSTPREPEASRDGTQKIRRNQAQVRKIGARSTPPSNIKACVAAPWLYFLLNYFSVLYSTFCP
jgi:hypothetical protein